MKRVKSWMLLCTFLFCFAAKGFSQYALQVDDVFIPIQNNDIISKRKLLTADTIRIVSPQNASKKALQTESWIILINGNEQDGAAYMLASNTNIFPKEAIEKIKLMDAGTIHIGRQDVNRKASGIIRLILGP